MWCDYVCKVHKPECGCMKSFKIFKNHIMTSKSIFLIWGTGDVSFDSTECNYLSFLPEVEGSLPLVGLCNRRESRGEEYFHGKITEEAGFI